MSDSRTDPHAPGASHGESGDEDLRLLADSARDFAMIFTDPERNVVRWSRGAEAVLGWTEAEAIGANENDLIYTPEDIAAGVPQIEQETALREGRAEDERWHLKKDGSRFFASGVMVPLYHPGTDALRGFGKVLRDVTEQRRAQEARAFLGAIVESSEDSIISVDFHGVVTSWNRAAERLYGHTAAETIGQPLSSLLLPENLREVLGNIDRVRDSLTVATFDSVRVHKNGRSLNLEVAMSPVKDDRGRVIGVSTIARDVSERRRTEEALRASEERFRLAAAAVKAIIYDWDLPSDRVTRTRGLTETLGYTEQEAGTTAAQWARFLHPDDIAQAATVGRAALDDPDAATYTLEYRARHKNGRWRHMSDHGLIVRDENGRAVRVVGSAMDVTVQKRMEEALRASEERHRLIVEGARDYAIFTTDPDGRIESWSPGAEAVYGWSVEEAFGRSMEIIYTAEDRAAGVPGWEQTTAARDGMAPNVRWHVRQNGTPVFIDGMTRPLRGADGTPRGFLKVGQDVTERRRAEEALEVAQQALRRANETLEARVAERTERLSRALSALEASLAERQRLVARLVEAQEEERRRISRELHDEMGQMLTGFALGLRNLEDEIGASPRLIALRSLADSMGREVHRIAVELRPTALDDVGLAPALEAYAEEWSGRTGVRAEFAAIGLSVDRLPPLIETTAYRVVQEALNNAAKYAVPGGATAVSVTLQKRDGNGDGDGALLLATVEDDGPGFDPDAAARRGRLGLAGMRERAELAGGSLEIETAPGEGTTLYLRLPLA